MRKCIFTMILTAGLLLSGCAKAPESVSVQTTVPLPAETEPDLSWQENKMRPDPMGSLGISRSHIVSVAFQDTLDGAPEDAWDVSLKFDDGVLAWDTGEGNLIIAAEGGINGENVCKDLFSECAALQCVSFSGAFHTETAANMSGLFSGCISLEEVDTENMDTSRVQDMTAMFYNCLSLKKLNIGSWNTGSTTTMNSMFWDCISLTSLEIGEWDTSNVTNMRMMFAGCQSLQELNLSSWDTTSVTDMESMFDLCISLQNVEIQIPQNANTTDIFWRCYSLDTWDPNE